MSAIARNDQAGGCCRNVRVPAALRHTASARMLYQRALLVISAFFLSFACTTAAQAQRASTAKRAQRVLDILLERDHEHHEVVKR